MHAFGSIFVGVAQGGRNFYRIEDDTGEEIWYYSDTGPLAACYTSGVADYDVELHAPARVIISTRDRTVRALRVSSGTQIWETTLEGGGPITGFALTQERSPNVLVASREEDLYALDAETGAVLWRYPFRSSSLINRKSPRPAIWGNYVIHIKEGIKLVAISLEDGTESWSTELDAGTFSSPTVGGRSIYIGTSSGSVYAFSQT